MPLIDGRRSLSQETLYLDGRYSLSRDVAVTEDA